MQIYKWMEETADQLGKYQEISSRQTGHSFILSLFELQGPMVILVLLHICGLLVGNESTTALVNQLS